jgi:RHS repeat-associated protein
MGFEVPYNGKENDDYVNGSGFCCDDNLSLRAGAIGAGNDNPELYQYYYHSDHLGSTLLITNLDGEVVQHVEYVPFGEVFIEERNNKWNTPYLFNAKELDEETGLYYYGARYYEPHTSVWLSVDPMQEKYPNISTYAYCVQNPIRYIDPTGMDWYTDNDGTYQYNPELNEDNQSEKLEKGQTYVGVTHQIKDKNGNVTEDYRKDGSIVFTDETSAYNRLWSQANAKEREESGYTLKNGKVLVVPDYRNGEDNVNITDYGYSINKNGILSDKDGNKFKITGNIHTHQNRDADATPSYYIIHSKGGGYGDLGHSEFMGGLPVIVIGHDGNIYGIYHKQGLTYGDIEFKKQGVTRNTLLSGKTKLTPWLNSYPTTNGKR